MTHLVLGVSNRQLIDWAKSMDYIRLSYVRMVAHRDSHTYHMFVPRPKDDRVTGLEFDKIIVLDGVMSVDTVYLSRIRTQGVLR